MRTHIVIALLTALALSGCASEGPMATEGEVDDSPSMDDHNMTADPVNEAVNRAPIAIFEADVLNGTAPLLVNFTIDGSDLDGDNLTWTLRVNGTDVANGSVFPSIVNQTFEAGNHTVALVVFDGMNETIEELLIVALPAVDTEPVFETVVLTQAVTLSCPGCMAGEIDGDSTCIAVMTDDNGLDCAFWPLEAAWVGRAWAADGMFLPHVEFYPDCTGSGMISISDAESGTIPDGAGCAVMFDPIDPIVTAKLTIS